MMNFQLEIWPEEITAGILKELRLRSRLLAKGERPDMRPWGGKFETGEHWRDDQKHRRYLRISRLPKIPCPDSTLVLC